MADPRHPFSGYSTFVALVEEGNDSVGEDVVERLCIAPVHLLRREVVFDFSADCPPILTVISFIPPPVEDAAMEAAVDGDFLAARPARFERAARSIEPDVASRDKLAGHAHIVVLQ